MPPRRSVPFAFLLALAATQPALAAPGRNWCGMEDRVEPFEIGVRQRMSLERDGKAVGLHKFNVDYKSAAAVTMSLDGPKGHVGITIGPFTAVQHHAMVKDGTHMVTRGGQSLPVSFSDKDVATAMADGRTITVEMLLDGSARFKRAYPLSEAISEGALYVNEAQGVPKDFWPSVAKGRTITFNVALGKARDSFTVDAAAYGRALEKGWKDVEAVDRDWRARKCNGMLPD